MLDHRWWAIEEIAAAVDVTFWPRTLAALLEQLVSGNVPRRPILVE